MDILQKQRAREAIGQVLQGDPPSEIEPETCGTYEEAVRIIYEAHHEGGTQAARRAFRDILPTTPGLSVLIAGAPPQMPRYILHWAAEALQPQPPIACIIAPWLASGSVNLVVGEGGAGKTYMLLDAAVAVALGEAWLDFQVKQCPVLLIDEESGPRRMARRLSDTMRGHKAGADLPLAYICLARFDLWNGDDIAAIQEAIGAVGAGLVIIDALADVMPGRDENAVKDVQPVFLALRGMAEETQAAIVIVHHSNKTGGYRGSTAIKGAVDLLLSVKKSGDVLTVTSEKARDIESVSFVARLAFEPDSFSLTPAEAAERSQTLGKSQAYVLRYLSRNGASAISEIQAHADTCSENSARQAVYALADRGYIHRVDAGGPGIRATYALTDQGTEAVAAEL